MKLNHRQSSIIERLSNEERISVRELALLFDVSEMTVRRDLTALEQQGLIVRTHGGGVAASALRFLQRAWPHYTVSPEKAAIGELAAGLVAPGQTVMVDSGATALEVARHLPQDAGITVATTSLCVAQELYGSPLNVLLFGGFLRKDFPSLYGPLTERMLTSFHVDILFTGCDGARSNSGFYSTDLHVSSLEQAMTKIATRVVVVTESAKFQRPAFARFATIEEVHTVITDPNITPTDHKNLEERGVTVLIAG